MLAERLTVQAKPVVNIYGIGRAMVDYYVEGRIDGGFMESVFCRLPDRLLPSGLGIPLHLEGDAFSFVLQAIIQQPHCHLLRETGGTCVNILKTIATLIPGSQCFFSGTVGTDGTVSTIPKDTATPATIDPDSTFLCRQLTARGIQSRLRRQKGHTGRCLVLAGSKDEEDSSPQPLPAQSWLALASPSVASEILPEQVERGWLEGCDWLVAEGMELDKEWLWQLLSQSKKRLVLACGTPFGAARAASFLKGLGRTQRQVLVLANDAEARILEQNGVAIGESSRQKNLLLVITHGSGGGSTYLAGKHLFVPAVPLPAEGIVDATGAGDVFAGALISRLIQEENQLAPQKIIAAMEFASMAAKQILQVPLCSVSALCPRPRHIRAGRSSAPPIF